MRGQHATELPGVVLEEIYTSVQSLNRELNHIRALADAIFARRDEIVIEWYDLYARCYGARASLTKDDFIQVLVGAIARNNNDLLRGDLEGYAAHARELAHLLINKRVSLAEAVILSHLFQASILRVLSATTGLNDSWRGLETLGLIRANLIAGAYMSVQLRMVPDTHQQDGQSKALARLVHPRVPRLVGKSSAMRRLARQILAAGAGAANVLIVGETGTGKELVARAIHECSPTAGAPFIPVNCAAIPSELIESELFGHQKGAFSGANADSPGLFRAAGGGTLFLDEVSEMAPAVQSKLLRAIQERAIRPVGSAREVPLAVRLLASTNRDPEEAIRAGHLRADLYYRLQSGVLHVPPLRNRREDIPLLVEHFIAAAEKSSKRPTMVTGIESGALRAMMCYEWPGNVRELANVIESAGLFVRSPTIGMRDLPAAIAGLKDEAPDARSSDGGGLLSLNEGERRLIHRALAATKGNKARAAAMLQISRKTLYAKLSRYQLRQTWQMQQSAP
jgi:DNA-binding NtrC family response regulator